MTPKTTELLSALHAALDQALDLDPRERSAWLAELRAGQPAVAAELETLLAEESELDTRGFLEAGEWSGMAPPPPLAGRRVGAYTIERPIGHGGMGTVWLARRSDGRYEGVAAVKLLNLALLDPVGRARFHREATALARLTHPNIARLIDAGVTDEGQPFLLLEYVEGKRIDAYCDEQRLSPERRLDLFRQVLGAVGHAHANLIVHRDLKPSNILVTADGSVKLLDFGIAKLLEDETAAGERSALTELGGLALTPEYAAPEQVAGTAVTTATDVYALGVLLYILLSGRHPTGEGCRSAAEHLRAITETDPLRLSVAMVQAEGGAAQDAAHTAAARGATVERLRRLYAGDLDNIVAKALKKEPAERYATVDAFAADVRRYLRHEPVSARPDSLGYRLGKFVRRNRTTVGLGAMAFAVLVAGVAGTVTQARRATRQAMQAQQQRDRANQAAQAAQEQRDFALRSLSRAEAINEMDQFLLLDAAPSGKPFTVGDLLARATDVVERERADSDANRTEMLVAIGSDYYLLDEDAKAKELLEQAYQLSRGLGDRPTRAMAACTLASEVIRGGDRVRAEQLVQEGLADLPAGPQFDFERVDCLQRGANVAANGGGKEALQRAQAALALYRQLRFPPPAWEPGLLRTLSDAYNTAGRYREAAMADEEASERLAALGRDNTTGAATLYSDRGLLLDLMGQPVKAEPLLRKAVQISSADRTERAVSPVMLINLARTLSELGRLGEARRLAERAYQAARSAGAEEVVNICLLVRAGIYTKGHQIGRAEAMLAEVEPRLARALPRGHYAFAMVTYLRALTAQARGDLPGALANADTALSMLEANVAAGQESGGYVPVVLQHRADIERAMGRRPEAERDARRAIELLQERAQPGVPSVTIGFAYLSLGRALKAEARDAEAKRAFESALAQLEPSLGASHPTTRQARALAEGTPAAPR